ncbi:MAG: hypothetical protein ACR2QO_16540 [Acidimicrobiales bacterium]
MSPELEAVERERDHLRRRLRSQKQLLATGRELAAAGDPAAVIDLPGRGSTPVNSQGRPLPILVEEPLIDLPLGLGAMMLSVLVRMSEIAQVICVSDQPDIEDWCQSMGDRAGFSRATGWFTGEDG